MIDLVIVLAASAVAVVFSYGLGKGQGYREGALSAHNARQRQLAAQIAGADKGLWPVSLQAYEEHALATCASKVHSDRIRWWDHITKKLAGETGEFMEHAGKASRDDDWDLRDGVEALTPERRLALLKELGDILWYIVAIAAHLGSSLAEVVMLNIKKRDGRKQRGTLKGDGDNR